MFFAGSGDTKRQPPGQQPPGQQPPAIQPPPEQQATETQFDVTGTAIAKGEKMSLTLVLAKKTTPTLYLSKFYNAANPDPWSQAFRDASAAAAAQGVWHVTLDGEPELETRIYLQSGWSGMTYSANGGIVRMGQLSGTWRRMWWAQQTISNLTFRDMIIDYNNDPAFGTGPGGAPGWIEFSCPWYFVAACNNLLFENLEFIDSHNTPHVGGGGGGDIWGIKFSAGAAGAGNVTQSNIVVRNCKHHIKYESFFDTTPLNGSVLTDVKVHNNDIIGGESLCMAILSHSDGGAEIKNIQVYNNTFKNPWRYGIGIGTDAGVGPFPTKLENIDVRHNHFTFDADAGTYYTAGSTMDAIFILNNNAAGSYTKTSKIHDNTVIVNNHPAPQKIRGVRMSAVDLGIQAQCEISNNKLFRLWVGHKRDQFVIRGNTGESFPELRKPAIYFWPENSGGTWIDSGINSAANLTGPFTFCAWLKMDTRPVDGNHSYYLVDKTETGGYPFRIEIMNTGLIRFRTQGSTGTWTRFSANPFPLWKRCHLAVVVDSQGGPWHCYFDGVADPNSGQSTGGSVYRAANNSNMFFGSRANDANNVLYKLRGTMEDVRVYNSALSLTNIQAIMNGSVVPFTPISHYRFSSGTGTIVTNTGSQGNGALVTFNQQQSWVVPDELAITSA